ncbi:MAG: AbrB/MazE/SpoVT family DNA-binding domain-containing protein [Dehalococcoidia bacterium]
MRTKVAKWGNSLAIRIPAAVAEEAAVEDGDVVDLAIRDGAIVISGRKPELRMSDILAAITDENMHEAIDFGPPVGKELL